MMEYFPVFLLECFAMWFILVAQFQSTSQAPIPSSRIIQFEGFMTEESLQYVKTISTQDTSSITRRKRDIENNFTNLAEIFRNAYKNPGLKGEIMYTLRKSSKIYFDFDYEALGNNHLETAELKLYKRPTSLTFLDKIKKLEVLDPEARVTVLQVLNRNKHGKTTQMLDSRLVSVFEKGWINFDVSKALRDWVQNTGDNLGLEVWVESAEPGKQAARISRKVAFVKSSTSDQAHHPSLNIKFN